MALPDALLRTPLLGTPKPRIAPPMPARSMVRQLEECAADLGLTLMEWQRIAARYWTALGPDERWLFRRFAAVVSRQNGKTEIIKPRVLLGFKLGRKMLHTAQDRARPRKSTFVPLAEFFENVHNRERYGVTKIREANGQEEIKCQNGAWYTIAAPRSGGARGDAADDIFIDEIREATDYGLDAIIRPTIIARPNPQVAYFSNAGHDNSVILNDLRGRREVDPNLAYLEWSAPPELDRKDPRAWAVANPALGITIDLETIADAAESMRAADFDTEHLCRWVVSMAQPFVAPEQWAAQDFRDPGTPVSSVMAVKMDAAGERAAAVVAWRIDEQRVALRPVADVVGHPIDVDRLGPDLVAKAREWHAWTVGYDPYTDVDIIRHFRKAEKVVGRNYASASEAFARRVADRKFVVFDETGIISADLAQTTRKPSPYGTFMAVKAGDAPNSAAQAAVVAAWLASEPRLLGQARIS